MRIRLTTWFMIMLAVALLSSQYEAGQRSNHQTSPTGEGQNMNVKRKEQNKPLACNILALNASQRERHKQLRGQMSAKVKGRRELTDGYEIRLSDESSTITTVAEWVTLERLCCPFFTFQIEITEPGSPLLLRLTGPEGVKLFLQSELGLK